ncbi:MAG: MFS transporter [Clostridia bacterium]|nr:MFS transporter [Clostridia bacterium]MBQ5959687.1 MFS transporter [Bacillota bacterium]
MAKTKKEYDSEGVKLTMRTRDYLADMSGQLALGLMANLVGQLQYFYTDKVGMAVGSVGVVMAISKILDAFTDVIFGNIVDHSRGGNKKYFRWMITLAVPAAAIVALLFMIPANAATGVQVAYALITNLLLTAVIYTMIATPFAAVMVVRTKSNSERSSMGIFRAVGNYGAGMIVAIATVPVTNLLGGTQSAWIKYGVVLALFVLLLFLICWRNGHKAAFTREEESESGSPAEQEEEPVPFGPAMGMLFKNKYWVIVLLFNTITAVTSAVAASSGTYYCKWIFGNDNLVAILGAAGMLGTLVGFVVSKPIINKFGVKGTVDIGLLGAAFFAGIRCFAPTNYVVYATTALLASFIQIPLMCLYGVLTAMTVDYNEWKYEKKLVAMSGGAIGFGNKVGSGLGSLLLSMFLIIGSYDPSLAEATSSMRWSIYGFSNYLPVVINLLMFFIFRGFDLEKKLPQLRQEIEARKAAKQD